MARFWGCRRVHNCSTTCPTLLFLHNLLPATHGSINGPTWSIALEMQFYVFMAFAMPWMARRRLWVVAATLILTAVAYRYALTLWLVPGQADTNLQMVYTSELPGTLDQFGCGIVLGPGLRAW